MQCLPATGLVLFDHFRSKRPVFAVADDKTVERHIRHHNSLPILSSVSCREKRLRLVLGGTYLEHDSRVRRIQGSQREHKFPLLEFFVSFQPETSFQWAPPSSVSWTAEGVRIMPCFSSPKATCKMGSVPAFVGNQV